MALGDNGFYGLNTLETLSDYTPYFGAINRISNLLGGPSIGSIVEDIPGVGDIVGGLSGLLGGFGGFGGGGHNQTILGNISTLPDDEMPEYLRGKNLNHPGGLISRNRYLGTALTQRSEPTLQASESTIARARTLGLNVYADSMQVNHDAIREVPSSPQAAIQTIQKAVSGIIQTESVIENALDAIAENSERKAKAGLILGGVDFDTWREEFNTMSQDRYNSRSKPGLNFPMPGFRNGDLLTLGFDAIGTPTFNERLVADPTLNPETSLPYEHDFLEDLAGGDLLPVDDPGFVGPPEPPQDTGTDNGTGTTNTDDSFSQAAQDYFEQQEEALANLVTQQQQDAAMQGDDNATADDKSNSALGLLGATASFLLGSLGGQDGQNRVNQRGNISLGGDSGLLENDSSMQRSTNVFEAPGFQYPERSPLPDVDAPLQLVKESPSSFPWLAEKSRGGLLQKS